jgi:hypothetical protein
MRWTTLAIIHHNNTECLDKSRFAGLQQLQKQGTQCKSIGTLPCRELVPLCHDNRSHVYACPRMTSESCERLELGMAIVSVMHVMMVYRTPA